MPNKQQILGINTCFDTIKYDGLIIDTFPTSTSFMDYDAVLIDSSYLCEKYGSSYPSQYEGKKLISPEESHKMLEDFTQTRLQLIELLKQGKNVFVLMATNDDCFVYTGKKEFSGTGKNARQTNIVNRLPAFSFLPIEIKPTMVTGEKFNISCKAPYDAFFQTTKDMIYYNAYFDATNGSALLTITNSNKAISAVFEYQNGKIILLPYHVTEEYYKTQREWNKNAKMYLDALFELNSALSSTIETYKFPLWTEKYKILNEEDEEKNIIAQIEKLKKIEEKIKIYEELLSKIRNKKILISGSGIILEETVKEILEELGFILHKTEKGRSDIIASYKDIEVVAEIKGVTKSAAEKHSAQLEKWVSQYIEENERSPKPILIVNGYCNTPLESRSEEVFPNQMLKYSEARNHLLITTTQLLCLYIDIKNNPSLADERITELLSCVGKYDKYTDFEKYIKMI